MSFTLSFAKQIVLEIRGVGESRLPGDILEKQPTHVHYVEGDIRYFKETDN